MTITSRFSDFLRRFAQDEKGTVLVETIIILPLFFWVYAGLFVYWDAFRTVNTVQKAAYTVSDLISRRQDPVDDTYLNGIRSTMNFMLDSGDTAQMRVTSYRWSEADNRYEVIFSKSPGNAMTALTTADLANLTSRLPIMFDGDSAVLVETASPYNPPLNFGLVPTTITQFIVTRPRFVPKLCHVSFGC